MAEELDALVEDYKRIADSHGEHRLWDLVWLVNELIYEREHPAQLDASAARIATLEQQLSDETAVRIAEVEHWVQWYNELEQWRVQTAQLKAKAEAQVEALRNALAVIHTTVRGDDKSECWTIRKWLDEHGVFNDDIQGQRRLVEAVCVFALPASPALVGAADPPRTEE